MESILLKDIIQKPISGEWGLEDLYGTGIPVLRTANFTNEGIINFENVVTRNISPSKLKGKLLQKGDILLEKSGGSDRQPVGRVVYFDGQADKYGFNNFTSALRISDLTMWNPKYIFYALYANYHHGGTRKYENKTTGLHNLKVDLFIRSFSVPYATLIKQNEIVKKLDLFNHLENVCEVQLQKLDELIKSRFLEMFGEPWVNDKEFPCYSVGQVAESVTYGTSAPASDSGQYEYLRMNNLTDNGQLDLSDLKRIDMSDEQAEKYMVKKGDILFNRTNSIDLVGKTALFNLNNPMIIAGYLIRIRLSDKVNPVYFVAYMNMPYMKEKLRNIAKGAVNQANINSKELKSIQILIPPLSLQNEYCNFVLSIDKSKMAVQKSLDELETLKKSLMQTYFG